MKRYQPIALLGLLLCGLCLLFISPYFVAPVNAQVFYYTPTANENGNIYYTIRQNDTCDSIALLNGADVTVIRELNQLTLDQCRFLQVGQQLLIAVVPTQAVTAGPSPTPTSNLPTPEPLKGYGTICVYLYNDVNGNAMAEAEETTDTGLAGGEISISNLAGDFVKNDTTLNNGEAVCFKDVPEGEYTVSIAIPDGYNPTAAQNNTIQLKAGDTATIDFSAQASSSLPVITREKSKSLFLAVVGGLILVAGLGLGLYSRAIRRR